MAFFDKKTDTEKENGLSASDLYLRALNYMVEGNKNKAMEYLKQSVRLDTNNIDAYLKLGILYRKTGHASRAYRIHKELTVRPGLPKRMRLEILQNIVLDLREMDEYENALKFLQEILEIDKKLPWAWEQKIEIFEILKRWKDSYDAYRQFHPELKAEAKKRLSCYKVEEGKRHMAEGKLPEARECFSESAKLSPGFPAPYVYAGDIHMLEGNTEQALAAWEHLIMDAPEKSAPVFTRFERVTFDEGHFDDMERIYSYVVEKAPRNKYAFLHLAEFYFRKGQYEQAIAMINQLLEFEPDSLLAHRNLVRYLENSSVPDPFLDVVHKLTDLIPFEIAFSCLSCGIMLLEPEVRCPKCGTWDPIEYGKSN